MSHADPGIGPYQPQTMQSDDDHMMHELPGIVKQSKALQNGFNDVQSRSSTKLLCELVSPVSALHSPALPCPASALSCPCPLSCLIWLQAIMFFICTLLDS